jgi:hypothetical protein
MLEAEEQDSYAEDDPDSLDIDAAGNSQNSAESHHSK